MCKPLCNEHVTRIRPDLRVFLDFYCFCFTQVDISPKETIFRNFQMSGQTRAGSARLNAYHGTKRQLTGTSAGQVAPAWRTANGAAAVNGSTSPLSKKALQRGSKILLSNLPMDVAESEIEVRALTFSFLSIVPSLLAGAIQENSGPNQGDVHHLQ